MTEPRKKRPDDHEPQVGGDPQGTGQEGEVKKKIVSPDPEKVEEAEKKKKRKGTD